MSALFFFFLLSSHAIPPSLLSLSLLISLHSQKNFIYLKYRFVLKGFVVLFIYPAYKTFEQKDKTFRANLGYVKAGLSMRHVMSSFPNFGNQSCQLQISTSTTITIFISSVVPTHCVDSKSVSVTFLQAQFLSTKALDIRLIYANDFSAPH